MAGLKEIEAVLTCYSDKKKEIDRDSEEFKKVFENIDLDIERLLTAFIYRGIQYNQFFVHSGNLEPLFYFTSQQKPLEGLKNALQGITEYTGQILKGILKNIFDKANEIKQVTDPHQGVVSIDLTALQNQIDVFNNKILNDRILFELAYNARRYLTDLFTGDNANFITVVPDTITTILQDHNTKNYGNFLKGVCNFLSTWDDKNKEDSNDPGDGTKWAVSFKKFEFNKENNPFIFDNGTEADGFDFAFNDVQNILYEKYADCVLPETFLECQQLFKRTRDICVTDKEDGLFYEIANLHTNDDFKNNTSLRSLDLLKICLPTNGETEKSFYNFFNRLPNLGSEYINTDETWITKNADDGKCIIIEKDKKNIIGYINDIPELVNQRKNDEKCPKIDNAIGKLTNFILIDNPNEVIDICNSKGYKQDFTEWEDINSLKYNVDNLKNVTLNHCMVLGKNYTTANSPIVFGDFTFTSPKDMVEKCNEQDFGKNGKEFPALFAKENNFNVGTYTKFHEDVFYIERRLYYVLCCIKTLGASIPRRFLKNNGKDENKNLLDSYRNCRNLSLLIENALTNVLIACARPDIFKVNDTTAVTGWKMLGWNDNCELHTESQSNGKTHWGHYDIFIGPKGEKEIIGPDGKKEKFYETGNFSIHYSPFYSEINARNVYAQTWEQSFLDYKSTVTKDIPISLEELKCGFFNYANSQTLIWNKTDFNNYIDSTYSRAFYDAGKYPYGSSCTDLQISLQKIIPELPISFTLTSYGDYPKDPCLLFNEKIADIKYDKISFSDVLDAYYSSDFYFKRENGYLSLTYVNTRKHYSFKTFGNNTEKKFENTGTEKNHNFSALLNGVKKCIDNFYKFYNDKEVFTSLQQVNFTDDKSKALLKLYLKNGLNIVGNKDYGNDFLNCFIKPNLTLLNNLKNYIIKVGKNEDRVKSFNDMTHRKQFYTEIYAKTNEDSDTKNKIDRYNKVFKLFNLEELQGGSVFVQNHSILDKEGKATHNSYSNFDQRLKGKVEDFFGKVHEAWCQKVMRYTTGDADKTLTEIFTMLGKTYDTLNTEVIDAVKTLKDNIKNIGDWFTRYNGNSLKNLKDCVGKIGDDMIANTALKELQDLFGTINPGNTTNNEKINPTKVKDQLNDVSTSLDAVINNLPKADTDVLKSIFILKPNKGEDEIDNYKNYKYKLEENKKELDQYKTWLGNYDRTILDELKTCFDSLKNHKTSLENLQQDIDTGSYPADLQVLKTLLGKDSGVGSIKNTCKDLKEKLNNLNTEAESKKVFFGGKQDLFKDYIQTLDKALNNLPKEDPELENDLDLINSANTEHGFAFLFEDTKRQSPEQIEGRFKENFGKIYKSITLKIQSLQDCIGDIDKILKEHLQQQLGNIEKLLDETKENLKKLYDLTKTDDPNSYMGTMKYICDNNNNGTSIGKLLGDGSGALEKIVNWKKGDANKNPFYQNLKDIENGLNYMLQTDFRNNLFEPRAININIDADVLDADDNVITYGDRIKDVKSTVLDDITQLAKDLLFNETVLNECLQG